MKTLITLLSISAALVSSLAAAEPTSYPLTTCVVSGEKLGGMGKPFVIQSGGTEVQLCCKECQKEFDENPAKFVQKVKDAEKSK